jgi:hypothetical protein
MALIRLFVALLVTASVVAVLYMLFLEVPTAEPSIQLWPEPIAQADRP